MQTTAQIKRASKIISVCHNRNESKFFTNAFYSCCVVRNSNLFNAMVLRKKLCNLLHCKNENNYKQRGIIVNSLDQFSFAD